MFVTVAADVARAYLDMRAQQRQLAVLGQNIEAARGNVDLTQGRLNRGLTNAIDVSLAKRQLATLQADLAPLGAQIDASRHAIAVLLGRFPEDLARELAKPGAIPALPAKIPVGQPADLLRRRPDIRQAERRLAAANARIGVATAELFPTVALSGAVGAQGGLRVRLGGRPVGRGALLLILGFVFLLGFNEAVVVAIPLVGIFLALNATVVVVGIAHIVAQPSLLAGWTNALRIEGAGPGGLIES